MVENGSGQQGRLWTPKIALVGVLVAALVAQAGGAIAAEAQEPTSRTEVEGPNTKRGDPDANPREVPALPSAKPSGNDRQPAQYGSFDNPPTSDGVAPEGWEPTTDGFVRGESKVDESQTSSTRRVFENPDGSKTAELTTSPVRFQDEEGDWVDFEPELVERDGVLVPSAAPTGSEIPTDPESDVVVRAGTYVGPVSLIHDGAGATSVKPDVESVTFEGVGEDDDLEVALTPTGFESTLLVAAHVEGGESFTQTLVVPAGVTARQSAVGVELVHESGSVIGSYGSGVAWDGAEKQDVQPVTTSLIGQKGDRVQVQVAVAKSWFDAPERSFPVAIDPTFTTWTSSAGAMDTYVQNNSSTPQSANVGFLVGPQPGNTSIVRRSFLKFDLSSIQGFNRQVLSADLDLFTSYSASCSARSMDVRNLTSAFNTSTIWSNQPSWGSTTVSKSFAKGYNSSCPGGVESVDVKPIVQNWMYASINHGFGLKSTSESSSLAGKSFTSAESWVPPKLTVTYNRPPTANAVQTEPIDDAYVSTTTPTLKYTPGTDPDGDPLEYWFAISTESDLSDGQVIASGWLPAAQVTSGWTVPEGTLEDGQTYYWTLYTADAMAWPAVPPATEAFTVDLRLGSGEWPTDDFGPASVNLTNGNLVLGHQSRSFPTVAGELSVGFDYNSQAQSTSGLTGSYYYLFGSPPGNRPPGSQTPQIVRRDALVAFDWGTGSPWPEIPDDGFYTKWTGNITVPTTGNYKFGGTCSDGMLIKINGSTAFDRWSACSPSDPDPWSGLIALTAGQPVAIEVEMYDNTGPASVNLRVRGPGLPTGVGIDVPAGWLTDATTPRLPAGWSLTTDLAGISRYRSAQIANSSVNLIDGAGAGHQYSWDASSEAWQPPAGESGVLTALPDGTYSLHELGTTYSFAGTGELLSVKDAAEMSGTVTPVMTYSPPDRLTEMEDPVSGRGLQFHYSGSASCDLPTGFSAAPAGMLCAVDYGDFSAGKLQVRYNSNGQVVRFDEPGAEITDLGYDGAGRVDRLRDPLAVDAVAASVRSDNDTTRTVIAYDGSNRVASVTLPEPLAGETRPSHTYSYTSGTTTDVGAAGLTSSSGRLRRVTFDDRGRQLSEVDLAGRTSNMAYDGDGRVVSTWNTSTGLKSTSVYDPLGNLTDEWGPAPTGWWTNPSDTGAPSSNSSATPRTSHAFDEGLNSLAAEWYNSTDLTGLPIATTTGVGHASGAISVDWASGSPSGVNADFSALLSGWINIPDANARNFRATFGGKAEVLIADQLVVDGWESTSGTADGSYQGPAGWTPIVVRYANPTGNASLILDWQPSGGSYVAVPGGSLQPGYGLETSTTDPDGKTVETSYTDSAADLAPEDRMPTSTTLDPAGLALVSTVGYEASGLRRPTSRSLPLGSGSTSSTDHYGGSFTRDVPCSGGPTNVDQAGLTKLQRSADPTGSGTDGIATELVYNEQGLVAASRVQTDGSAWTCTTYDSRGRPTQVSEPALAGRPSRTRTMDHAVSSNPLVASIDDTVDSGATWTITTTRDLLGQARTMTDAWGKTTTTTIDAVSRTTKVVSPVGTQTMTYDNQGNDGPTVLDGTTLATPSFDGAGRIESVILSNGIELDPVGLDDLGRVTSTTWRKSSDNSVVASETADFSLANRQVDSSVDGFDPRGGNPNYAYDGAGRLTDAWTAQRDSGGTLSTHRVQSGYGAASSSCAGSTQSLAGKNTNRTHKTVDDGGGAVATYYCYDAADRLVATDLAGVGNPAYDNHGNTTGLWGETRSYDASARHLGTTKGTTSVTYTRDGLDRIVERELVVGGSTTEYQRLGYIGPGDGSAFTMNSSGATVERSLPLPGGVVATFRASQEVWSISDLSGSVLFTTDSAGVLTKTRTSDPNGSASGGAALPDNGDGSFDYSFLGGHRRPLEHAASLAETIEMGARQYDPELGRFLEVDPIVGASANAYDYATGDPVGSLDTDGHRPYTRKYSGWRKYPWWAAALWTRTSGCVVYYVGVCATLSYAKYRHRWDYYGPRRGGRAYKRWYVKKYDEIRIQVKFCPSVGWWQFSVQIRCWYNTQNFENYRGWKYRPTLTARRW